MGPVITAAALRDRVLARACRQAFSADTRLDGFRLRVSVAGQVAHISGSVGCGDDRRLVRAAAAGIRGIAGVWDVLKTGNRPLLALDIGCGAKKQYRKAVGVDLVPGPEVKVLADLARGLPFHDGEVDYIFCAHCLEHVTDLLAAMNEIHRVLAPSGCAHIMVPAEGSTNAVADPTHVRFFNRQSFKYFCSPHPGLALFRPVLVTGTPENVLADLSPVKAGGQRPTREELALFFD